MNKNGDMSCGCKYAISANIITVCANIRHALLFLKRLALATMISPFCSVVSMKTRKQYWIICIQELGNDYNIFCINVKGKLTFCLKASCKIPWSISVMSVS